MTYGRLVILVVALSCLLAGCSSDLERRMKPLRKDPMASASWDGLILLAVHETEDRIKPPPPNITHCYQLTISVEQAFEVVIATAEQHGWTEDPTSRNRSRAILNKEIKGRTAQLELALDDVWCKLHSETDLRLTLGYKPPPPTVYE